MCIFVKREIPKTRKIKIVHGTNRSKIKYDFFL